MLVSSDREKIWNERDPMTVFLYALKSPDSKKKHPQWPSTCFAAMVDLTVVVALVDHHLNMSRLLEYELQRTNLHRKQRYDHLPKAGLSAQEYIQSKIIDK
jgi:hypothetical protein